MSSTTEVRSPAQPSSLATSAAFKTFAMVLAIATPVIYVLCEMRNWPLFTYHPATNRIDWLYAPPVRNEGPAMYWYGWIATTMIASGILGILAMLLPERITKRIPLSLVWILPLAAVPVLIYALNYFWRW
jgi:hypothetical protein